MQVQATWLKRPGIQRLFFGLLLTTCLSIYVQWTVEGERQVRFNNAVFEIQTRISSQLQLYQYAVFQTRGIFVADPRVSRQEFHDYIANLDFSKTYPGVQGIGFAERVPKANLRSFVAEMRKSGFSNFKVWPEEPPRDDYFSIKYIEPFDWRNQRALGYDMFSDPARRAAMELARDTGRATITAKVTLVQETEKDVQPGFLIYVPIYRKDLPVKTIEQRRNALVGYVYSPFRAGDLFDAIFVRKVDQSHLDFEIFDGESLTQESLLYDHDGVQDFEKRSGRFELTRIIHIPVDHRIWTIYFRTLPGFYLPLARFASFAVALVGTLVSFLLYRISENTRKHLETEKASFEELERTKERLRLATEGSEIGIWEWNISNQQVYLEGFEWKLLGLSGPKAEISHEQFFEKIHPDDRERVRESLQSALDRKTPWSDEFRVQWADGSIHWLVGKARPFSGLRGKPIRMLGIHFDITPRKLTELDLQYALGVRDEFISIASHELKTPITSMKMQIQILDRMRKKQGVESLQPERLSRTLETCVRQLDRLDRLVEDMLDISRMGSDKFTFDVEKADFSHIVLEVLDQFQIECQYIGCEIRSEIEPGLFAELDRFRMEQVVSNLIGNAIKYGAGSPIEVILRRKGAELVELRVRDYGLGIAKEAQDRIFNRFERAVSVRNISGLGLGLYIVRNIVDAHHGSIRVESDLGQGAIFIVELPTRQRQREEARSPDATV
jgi:PAS domain S-box-containing protein